MISQSSFCLVAAIIAVASVFGSYASLVEEELPVVTINHKGQQVSVPYYENREPVDEQKKKFDVKVIDEIGQVVGDMVHDALMGRNGVLQTTRNMMNYGKKLLKVCNDNKAWLEEQRKENIELGRPTKPGYMKEMGGLVQDIFDYNVCSEKKVPKRNQPGWCSIKKPSDEDRQEHVDQIKEYLNMFRALSVESAVGSYLDWRHMRIGDKTIVEAFGEEVSFFRRCGFSTVLTVMSWLSGSLKKM